MTWLSGAALCGAALVFLRYYFGYLRARRDECLGFLAFLCELERGMEGRLESPNSVARRMDDPRLRRSGFLDALLEGADLPSAFSAAYDRLLLPSDVRRILKEYFDGAGARYLDGELRLVGRVRAELEKIAVREGEEVDRRSRVAGVLAFAVTAGVLLLFM